MIDSHYILLVETIKEHNKLAFEFYLSTINKKGCSDTGCKINPPIGMGTNGGCICGKEFRRSISRLGKMAEELEKSIK